MIANPLESTTLPRLAVAPQGHPSSSAAKRIDHPRAQRAIRELLFAIGEDPDRDGLRETPARVARACAELFAGLHEDPTRHLKKTFDSGHPDSAGDVVIVRDIPFSSTCEHHLLPFTGHAHIAYLPSAGRVVGLSKLARLVDGYARRPQVQERLTRQIADALSAHLHPAGVAVLVESQHSCMSLRGIRAHGSTTLTRALRGTFANNPALTAELLHLMHPRTTSPLS